MGWRHTERFKSAERENGQDLVTARIGTRLMVLVMGLEEESG